MSLKDKEKWESKYSAPEHIPDQEPSAWLKNNAEHLAVNGKALDLAMGEGRNAVFLAQRGYDVTGVEIAAAAIGKAEALARQHNVRIATVQADLDDYAIEENAYDLILCFNFLDRRLFPGIRRGLKPGGLLFYETFSIDHLKYSRFKKDWVLEHNELLRAFGDWRILKYEETDRPDKACASLLARKGN
jgi:SAM-dependent methyltransferase